MPRVKMNLSGKDFSARQFYIWVEVKKKCVTKIEDKQPYEAQEDLEPMVAPFLRRVVEECLTAQLKVLEAVIQELFSMVPCCTEICTKC